MFSSECININLTKKLEQTDVLVFSRFVSINLHKEVKETCACICAVLLDCSYFLFC